MDIQTKDGITLRGIPDGTPDDVIKARIDKIRAEGATPAVSVTAPRPTPEESAQFEKEQAPQADTAEMIAGHPATRFALGAASPALGTGQFFANLSPAQAMMIPGAGPFLAAAGVLNPSAGKRANEQAALLEAMKQRGMQARGDDTDIAGLAGSVLSPVSLGMNKIMNAVTLPKKMLQGAVVGGTGAAMQPVTGTGDFDATKLEQGATGTALGGAIPVAGKVLGTVGDKLSHMLPGGLDKKVGEILNTAAGSKIKDVVDALTNAQPLVGGRMPTAGQAAAPAGSAEFSALQKISEAINPTKYNDINAVQQAGRESVIRAIGRDEPTLNAAIGKRAGNALQNYGKAYEQQIKGDPDLAVLASNPYFAEALPDATKLAKANGIDAKNNLTEFLHFVKLSLDKNLAKTGDTALSTTEKSAVQDVKKQLVDWIGKKNPDYEAARAEFAAASKPINQMQVGQKLSEVITNPLTGAEKAQAFVNAAENAPKTIKSATGQRYNSLDQVLEPINANNVQRVSDELSNLAQLKDLANKGGSAVAKQLDISTKPLQIPNQLDVRVSVGNSLLRTLQGKVTDKTMNAVSKAMQDPAQAAALMQKASPKDRSKLVDALIKFAPNAATIGAGRAIGQENN